MLRKKTCIAMLLAGGQGSRLGILTKNVAKPAVPYRGKYRIIDFPLSNCTNSGIDTVGVLTQYQPLELNAYIGSGAPWDLDISNGGVFVLPPYQKGKSGEWYRGTANAIYQNMAFIEQYHPDYVLILSGDHIYKMDYNAMLDYHISHHADATIAVREVPWEEASRFGIMNTNPDGSIYEFEEKPTVAQLRNMATTRLSGSDGWVPKQNISVNFVQLWNTPEYADFSALQRLKLCDTCGVFVPMYNISLRAKIVKVVYNTLLNRYDSMELGDNPVPFSAVVEKLYDSKVAGVEAGLRAVKVDIQTVKNNTEAELTNLRDDLETQIDAKIETWAQTTNPATAWTTAALRTAHNGDLWLYTGTRDITVGSVTIKPQGVYQYDSSTGAWAAYSSTSDNLFDLVDGKSTIFYGSTSGSYPNKEVGDYLVDSSTGNTYRWSGSAWTKVTDYRTYTDGQISSAKTTIESEYEQAISDATDKICGGTGGYVVTTLNANGKPIELVITDNLDLNQAVNVWRWNQGGLGHSHNGYSGPYNDIALTYDGKINASMITAGTLNANIIRAGTLQDVNGNTSFNLSTGKLDITKGTINLGNGNFKVDSSGHVDIKEGTIDIGNGNFKVDASGHVYIKGGCIDVADGKFTVSNYGTVQAVDIQVRGNTFHVNESGHMWVNYANIADSSLVVSDDSIRMDPHQTTSSAPNLYLDSYNYLRESTWTESSRTIKKDIEPVRDAEIDPKNLYDVDIVQFKYIDGILSKEDKRYDKNLIGFIIEDLDEKYPVAVDKDGEDPKRWTWNVAYMIPAMMKLIQGQKAQIDEFKFRMREIEEEINGQRQIN